MLDLCPARTQELATQVLEGNLIEWQSALIQLALIRRRLNVDYLQAKVIFHHSNTKQ